MQTRIPVKDTALLVIDTINSCCHINCEPTKLKISFTKIRKMVPGLKRFISKYRISGGQVIYINCAPWQKENLASNIVQLYEDPRCSYYSADKTGFAEQFFGVQPEKEDIIITKNSYDAFTNPKLDSILKRRKVHNLLITGVFGDGCVHSTIQGGFSKGYNLIILKDLIETTDVEIRQELQKLLKEYTWPVMFGKTIDSREADRHFMLSQRIRKNSNTKP